jgi:hypothetical protein
VVSDDSGSDLVHFEAAVRFGDFDAAEPEFSGFFQQIARDREILVLDFLDIRQNLVDGKLFRRLPDELMLLAEIFRRENLVGLPGFQQKAAARNPGLGNCGGRGNSVSPSKETAGSLKPRRKVTQQF